MLLPRYNPGLLDCSDTCEEILKVLWSANLIPPAANPPVRLQHRRLPRIYAATSQSLAAYASSANHRPEFWTSTIPKFLLGTSMRRACNL